jgi:4'-phosphopantetheinyl transferase EntD
MCEERSHPVVTLATAEELPCARVPTGCPACRDSPRPADGEWCASRVAAGRAAAAVLPDRIPVALRTSSPGRAPRVVSCDPEEAAPLPVRLSLSHRDGRAAAIADPIRRVGVDLEREDAVPQGTERYFLTPGEIGATGLDATSLWALKEAAWKALECGDSTTFDALVLRFGEDDALRAVDLHGVSHPAVGVVMRPWPGYLLAALWLEDPDT